MSDERAVDDADSGGDHQEDVLAMGRGETPAQRADRNFNELLQELRVLQTGVQILFGFLLILAVQPRFADVSGATLAIYVVTLVLCCVSTGLLMAPVAYHRTLFAQGRKHEIVRISSMYTKAGMLALFLTVVGATMLVLDLVVSTTTAVAVTLLVAVTISSLWFLYPVYRRRHPDPSSDEGSPTM